MTWIAELHDDGGVEVLGTKGRKAVTLGAAHSGSRVFVTVNGQELADALAALGFYATARADACQRVEADSTQRQLDGLKKRVRGVENLVVERAARREVSDLREYLISRIRDLEKEVDVLGGRSSVGRS